MNVGRSFLWLEILVRVEGQPVFVALYFLTADSTPEVPLAMASPPGWIVPLNCEPNYTSLELLHVSDINEKSNQYMTGFNIENQFAYRKYYKLTYESNVPVKKEVMSGKH